MGTTNLFLRKWHNLSLLCFVLGILAWLPNFTFGYGYSYWLLTFIINPIGIWFGVMGKSRIAILLNILMTFSFFFVMLTGYLYNAVKG